MSTLSVTISDPKIVVGRKNKIPMTQFKLTWGILEDQENEAILLSCRGCFARWEPDEKTISWSYPLVFTGFQRESLHEPSPKLYRMVKEALERAGVHTTLRDKWTIFHMAETAMNPLHEKEGQTTEKL